jgi:BirA family biotin operon repressor/biotin-[acetyl-CoA-carboxylase] ligase
MVVGIGLNVNQTLFTSDASNPVSMKMISGRDYNLYEILQKLLDSIFERYTNTRPETTKKIENDYQSALYRWLEWHKYRVNGVCLNAKITGTNAYGQLVLETEGDEVLVCDLQEIKFII